MTRDLSNTANARFVEPPYPQNPHSNGAVNGVWLMPGEDVRWHTQTTPVGRTYVTGYEIITKRRRLRGILDGQVKHSHTAPA